VKIHLSEKQAEHLFKCSKDHSYNKFVEFAKNIILSNCRTEEDLPDNIGDISILTEQTENNGVEYYLHYESLNGVWNRTKLLLLAINC